mmetsp:Transcript_18163/g.29535  ORF Transcript_18163/g.29535 Transcript_18163/m.29535 type:complete len:782 (-) Transcript_18163:15-2360(-)
MGWHDGEASARVISKGEYDVVASKHKSRTAQTPAVKREYDVCMVFRHKTSKYVKFEDAIDEFGPRLREPTEEAKGNMEIWKHQRDSILKSLENCGLRLFCFYSRDRDEIFCKIGASAQKLKNTAARIKYKLQLKPEYLGAYAEFRHDFPGRPERRFEDRRCVSQYYKVHADDEYPSEDSIFTTRDKISLINHIVTSRDKDCAGLNIGTLLHTQEVRSFFPLHEQHAAQDLSFRTRSWVYMPHEHATRVRDYFGEKVAFYFLFMSFYWKWLLVPTFLGLACQVFDVLMRTPDNLSATPFCIVSAIWATMLPHFWRREEAKHALVWGTLDVLPELEPPRPEYYGVPRINPVSGEVEPYFPGSERRWKYVTSFITIAFSGVLLTAAILGLLYARHMLKGQVSGGIVTFQFLLACFVEVVNSLLTLVSKMLTNRENHRSQRDHDVHLLNKVMAFKFVNSYFVLYYIAFFKKHSWLFGTPMTCIRDDCFLDLQAQLAIFTVVRLTVKNLVRFGWPRFIAWYRRCRLEPCDACHVKRLELADLSLTELQNKKEQFDTFTDFDEVLITHGYASLFAVSSPWVCAATLLWVVCELLLDMKGLTESRRRPFPVRVRGTEPWNTAFEVYGGIAALTNISLLVFTSREFEDWKISHKVMLFVYLMHLVFFAKLIVKGLLPEMPRSVEMTHAKQEIVAQRCLENAMVEHRQEDMSRFLNRAEAAVTDQQVHDEDPEPDEEHEPGFSLIQSWRLMKEGFREHVPWRMLLLMIVSLILCTLVAVSIVSFNVLHFK